MQIINRSKNTVLADEVIIADTPFKRIRGLLGKKDFKPGQALILKPCNSIHTLFMRFPIDVLFVNCHNRVIKTYHTLKPWRVSGFFFNATFCIELPRRVLNNTQTRSGDLIEMA